MDAQQLAEAIQNELDKHEEKREAEKTRHEREMQSLRSDAGLDEVADAASRVAELSNKKSSLENDIEKSFFKVVQSLAPRARQSGDHVTIRDGAIWYYGRSNKVALDRFLAKDKYRRDTRHLVDEDNRELFDKILDEIQSLELDKESNWSHEFVNPRVVERAPDNVNFKYIGVRSQSPRNIGYGDSKGNLFGWSSNSMSPKTDNPAELKRLVQCKPTLMTMYQTLEDDLEERVEKREAVKKSITSMAAKHLVAASI